MDTVRIADLRARGVDAAMELVAELGEEGLTMRGLARRLGVSTTAMYQIFESKAAIVRAIRLRGAEELHAALAPAFTLDDPLERIRDMSRRYVAFARSVPWLYRTLFTSEPLPPGSLTDAEVRSVEASLSALVVALREGTERGRLRADLDLDLVPYRLWARNHGLVMLLLSGKLGPQHPMLPVDDLDGFVERFFSHTLGALAAPSEAAC
jgi:AcrR family transcriptional regulator